MVLSGSHQISPPSEGQCPSSSERRGRAAICLNGSSEVRNVRGCNCSS